VNLLGGSYRRYNSQHRRNRGDDMRQPTHLAGFVASNICERQDDDRKTGRVEPEAAVQELRARRELALGPLAQRAFRGLNTPNRAEPDGAVPTLRFRRVATQAPYHRGRMRLSGSIAA
jgi:hypothetical protein